jgi:hypothetical protein
MKFYGRNYTRNELLARVGDLTQIARIKPYRLTDGREDGVQAFDVIAGEGLEFTVLASRGLDISEARYRGVPLAWRSPTSDAHPAYFDSESENGRGWLRSFTGGLLTTCGLTWVGAPDEENGQRYGLHGRVSNLPASHLGYSSFWDTFDEEEHSLTVRGQVREATVFGENLELQRQIRTGLGQRVLRIFDSVSNLGHRRTEHMLLYHINLGFPIVNDGSRLISPSVNVTRRDTRTTAEPEDYARFQPPDPDTNETVFFHEMAPDPENLVTVAVVNPEIIVDSELGPGLGVYCRYRPSQLPRFVQWKMLGAGTYVVGLEPANCLVLGRPAERAANTLQFLEPGETREYKLEIGVLVGQSEITELETCCRQAVSNAAAL